MRTAVALQFLYLDQLLIHLLSAVAQTSTDQGFQSNAPCEWTGILKLPKFQHLHSLLFFRLEGGRQVHRITHGASRKVKPARTGNKNFIPKPFMCLKNPKTTSYQRTTVMSRIIYAVNDNIILLKGFIELGTGRQV